MCRNPMEPQGEAKSPDQKGVVVELPFVCKLCLFLLLTGPELHVRHRTGPAHVHAGPIQDAGLRKAHLGI